MGFSSFSSYFYPFPRLMYYKTCLKTPRRLGWFGEVYRKPWSCRVTAAPVYVWGGREMAITIAFEVVRTLDATSWGWSGMHFIPRGKSQLFCQGLAVSLLYSKSPNTQLRHYMIANGNGDLQRHKTFCSAQSTKVFYDALR